MGGTSTTAAGSTDEKTSTCEGSPTNISKKFESKPAKKDHIILDNNKKKIVETKK